MSFYLSQRSKYRLRNVDPRLSAIAERAIELTKIDFGIPSSGGYRTAQQQAELFRDGKSNADGVTRKSRHQSGRAFDVYAYVNGEASWEVKHLAQVAAAILQAANDLGIKIQWGGLWESFIDMPHFELAED